MTNNTSGTNQNITENVEDIGSETANVSNAEGISDVCFDISEEGTLIINKPAEGVIQPIAVEEGQNYVFNVNPATITGTEVSGENLVVKFDNGSSVILENYSVASNGSEASLNFMDGRTFTLAELAPAIEPLVPEEELEEPQAEIRDETAATDESGETSGDDGIQISQADELSAEELNEVAEELAETEPAAGDDLAAQLANIEPAAGDAGAAGGNSGYGFESSFQAQGVIPLEDIGPINPTELQYNLPQVEDTLFIEEDPEAPPPIDPNVEFDNQQVLEDGSVLVLIEAVPVTADGVITLTLSGIPSTWGVDPNGGTYDSVAGTWTITTTAGSSFSGGPILSPPADSDVDLSSLGITSTETSASTGRSGTYNGTIQVIVDAVADDPDVDGNDATGNEGDTLAIDIPTALTGEEVNNGGAGTGDGTETITNIIISPVDPAIDLNDFTITNVNGPVTLDANGNIVLASRADLNGLEITPKDPNFNGSIDLTIILNTRDNPTDVDFITTNNTAQDTDTITLTWKPTANPPTVLVNNGIENAQVLEDNSVDVPVVGTLDPAGSGNEILTLTVTGIDLTRLEGGEAGFTASNGPNGEVWTRVAGSPDTAASYTITLTTGGANYLGTFNFDPADDSDLDLTGMSVTASAFEPATSTTASSAADDFNVIVDAVADAVDINATGDSGNEGQTLDITVTNTITGEEINNGVGGDDGSENIVNIVISAVDPSVDLSQFTITNANGPVTLDSNGNIVFTDMSDLNGLEMTPNDSNYSGSFDLRVTFTTTERPISDTDFDDTNDFAQDVEVITMSWAPVINPPSITVNNGIDDAQVKEDNSVDVPVEAAFGANPSAAEYLTLTVTGIDLTVLQGGDAGFTATDSTSGASWTRVAGSPDNAASYTITLAAGETYSGTFTFDPIDQGDFDLTGMSVSVTATDPSVSPAISASSSDDFNVIVDAVADDPTVDGKDNTGTEGTPLAVDIDGALGVDTDGSESIEGYEVRGDAAEMANFTFTVNGVERAPVNGVISLTVAEVDALVVTPKDPNFSGDLDLNAVILTADNPTDGEYDTSDNTNSASDPFTLSWTPTITPPKVDVTEAGTGAEDAKVYEDNTAVLDVVANLAADHGPQEYLTLTVTGIDLTKLEGGEAGFVASDSTSGASWTRVAGSADTAASYTITLAAGEDYNGTFSFDILADSDLDLTGMNVTALATDPSVDPILTASADDSFNVYVDAVADAVDIIATGDTGEEGDVLDITITNAITGEEINNGVATDDGSERIVNLVIEAPAGVDLQNDFVVTNDNGNVTFDSNGNIVFTNMSDLNGLKVQPIDSTYTGSIELKVTFTTTERPISDTDFDDTNDFAQDVETIKLTWNDDDEPLIATPNEVKVDESDFVDPVLGQDSANNVISVDFGDDTAGATINGNGVFNTFGATSNGDPITVTFDAGTNTYTGTAGGRDVFTLTIDTPAFASDGNATSNYTFTLTDTIDHLIDGDNSAGEYDDSLPFTFGFTATDSDGDKADGTITVNVFDDGLQANDDCAAFEANVTNEDFNIVLVLDVSGSMAGDKIALLKSSVANLLGDYNAYQGGDVKVHLVTFSSGAGSSATFTVTEGSGYTDALSFVNGLGTGGTTNYEAPLQSAIDWLQGGSGNDPIAGADTYTYFISDGEPNRYVDVNGNNVSGNATRAMNEITGSDGSDEVSLLQSLSTEVISVGIGVNGTTLGRLGIIDSDGNALDVQDPNDLYAALAGTNPITGSVSGNVITGEGNTMPGGADVIGQDNPTTVTAISFNGSTIAVDPVNGATISGNNGTLKIYADGSYTYKLNANVTSASLQNEDNFTYTLTDGDGDFDTANLCMKVTLDDIPQNIQTEKLAVDESDFDVAPLDRDVASGTVTANFGSDAAGAFFAVGDAANTTSSTALTSNGDAVNVTLNGNKYVGATAAETVFELVINANGTYTFTLLGTLDHPNAADPNDIISINFEVVAQDGDGDKATGTITVDVLDDGPVAHDDFNKFTANETVTSTDGNVITGLNGGAGAADNLSEDVQNTVTKVDGVDVSATGTTTINGQYGVLEIAADGSYTYTLNDTVDNLSTVHFGEPNDFPSLAERQALDSSDTDHLGVYSGALDAENIVNGSATFVSEGAGYNNSFGYYTVAADGTLKAATMSVANTNNVDSVDLGNLNAGAGESLGFFIIADGFDTNAGYNGIDLSSGTLEFVYKYGSGEARAANISDDGGDVALVFTSAGGTETVLQGAVYHTTERGSTNNLNADDTVRVVSGIANGDDSVLRIGFEDLPGLGDKDYNDFIFDVRLDNFCLTDNFTYTLTDGDGDTSEAVLTLKTILEADDKPTDIVAETLSVDESDFDIVPTGEDSDSGSVTANFGNDGPGTFEVGNPANTTSSVTLTSNGQPVDVTISGNKYVGSTATETIFELEVGSNGDYTFTLLGQLDHPDALDPNDVINITFDVIAKDADGDTAIGKISVDVLDDAPVANDDVNVHNGVATGNVVTGLNGGAGAADDLSSDVQNTVTKVSFGGNDVNVPQNGSYATIDGDYGQLKIDMNGQYTFTPKDITVTTFTTLTLSDPATGVVIEVNAVETASGVEFTVDLKAGTADMSAFYLDVNNDGGPIYSVGGSANSMNPSDGYDYGVVIGTTGGNDADTTQATFTIDGITLADLGGAEIGVRAHSVGDDRQASLKLKGDATLTTTTEAACGKDVFTYELTDNDGDSDTATLTLMCNDDGTPSIGNAYNSVDETDLGPVVVSGHVDFNYGTDGAGSFGAGNPANVTFSGAKNNALTSNGVAVVISLVGNKYVGKAGGEKIFELDLKANGDYTFRLLGTLDHADTTNPDDVITMNFEAIVRDADGDVATGNVTIFVKDDGPVAHDDFASFDKAIGEVGGNVITGLNGGTGAADDLSQDVQNTVTKIAFGGKEVNVTPDAVAMIEGDNGTLYITANGNYNYVAHTSSSTTTGPATTLELAPVQSDASGQQTSITKNGITVAVSNTGNFDISWVNTADGSGLGIDNLNSGDSTKIWPSGEGFNISFGGEFADKVVLTISELGDNNDNGDKGADLVITLADGSKVNAEFQFDPAKIVNGHTDITLDSADYGQDIQSVHLASTNAGNYSAASMLLNNVTAEFAGEECGCAEDQFTYTLTDADGDSSTAILDIECYTSELIVGQNVDDTDGSTVPHLVGGTEGDIVGGEGSDILIGDAGGSKVIPQTQNYNVLFVLDVSGSMESENRIGILADAVENLLNDFNAYQSGEVKVHFSTFSTNAGSTGTFTVTNTAELAAAVAFLQGLNPAGTTNYEAGLQSGIEWLQSGDTLNNAETITYFISDGAPNRYLDGTTLASITSDQQYYDEVTGVDGTDEIGSIQGLSDKVISVGINIYGANNEAKLDGIASNGNAILIDDPNDLNNVLQETNPLISLDNVGGDELIGGDRSDLIFGDVVNTDTLADDQGLSTQDGSGWEVFERLENGEGGDAGWTREDTIEYIRGHQEELAAESTNSQGGRSGGDDIIDGGKGDDVIFGQEGDDIITGGEGNDILYGGSGKDTFLFESVNDGVDTIKDFEVGDDALDFSGLVSGYNSLQEAINDFVFETKEEGGNTVVSVDVDGQGGGASAVQLVVLEGITGVTIQDITKDNLTGSV